MSFDYALIQAMKEWDLHLNSVNLETGKYHRFRSLGTCKTKCCEYRIFENELGAHFKCFRRGIDRFWFAGSAERPSLETRRIIALERDRCERDRRESQERAAARCERFFNRLPANPPTRHPYVLRKQIYPHCAKPVRGMVVLPIRNIFHDMQSLQFIKRNGFKQLKTGASAGSGMIWLTPQLPYSYSGVIRICEGWSTGCTIYAVTKSPVICALNAYNLPKVAVLVRRHFTQAIIKICGDNDQWGKENVGMQQAEKASEQAGAALHYPQFDELDCSGKPTDFNDLYALAGLEIVKRQLVLIRS